MHRIDQGMTMIVGVGPKNFKDMAASARAGLPVRAR
jgi:hypothetical protein